MVDPHGFVEPPIDPLADTNPSQTIRQVQLQRQANSGWRRAAGLLSLLGAVALTLATTVLIVTTPSTPTPAPPSIEILPTSVPVEVTIPPTTVPVVIDGPGLLPTANAETIASILNAPVAAQPAGDTLAIGRDNFQPFTIVKQDRPRSEVIQYVAVQGDTINSIADRYNITAESIAWSNSRRIVLVLRPGDEINIPPVDGVYVQVIGSKTVGEWAAQYKVDNAFTVIDSEYNTLPAGTTPDSILPSGTWLFIPGGQGESITWTPEVTVDSSSPNRQGFVLAFAPGERGSCGNVDNQGGGAGWSNPLPNGVYTRGFTSFHTGIDLSAPVGTPVLAANSGTVIFAGWNSWGYGNTVVLAHGPFLTLYGHMSAISVGCGQFVGAGQVVGQVGSTGNSSGPHLHFEIRNGLNPSDPLATIPNLGF